MVIEIRRDAQFERPKIVGTSFMMIKVDALQRPNPLQDIACNVQNNQQKRMLQCNIPTGIEIILTT